MRRFLPLLASLVLLALPAAAQAYTFYEYETTGQPGGITVNGAGELMFTLSTSKLGSSTLGGVVQPGGDIAGGTSPTTIVPGPGDGSLWFIDGAKVGRKGPGAAVEFNQVFD